MLFPPPPPASVPASRGGFPSAPPPLLSAKSCPAISSSPITLADSPRFASGPITSTTLTDAASAPRSRPKNSSLLSQSPDSASVARGRVGSQHQCHPALAGALWRTRQLRSERLLRSHRLAPGLSRRGFSRARSPHSAEPTLARSPGTRLSKCGSSCRRSRRHKRSLYQFYADSGAVLYALARDAEAEAAWQHALGLAPEDPNVHLFLAQLYQQQRRPADAEREYRAALSRRESSVAWYALGRLLATQHRYAEAEQAIATAAIMTATPANQYKALGQVQLRLDQPDRALASLLKAEHAGPSLEDTSPTAREFRAQVADGRGRAWLALHDAKRATAFLEQSTQLAPEPQRWTLLADCYAAQGRSADAEQARSRAKESPASQ